MMNTNAQPWWQTAVIYQIYPRSFQDSDGDGVGDLRGITARLEYLRGLGVDALWISPFYPSPMADFGYDVADYTGVDKLFGTLDDFDELLAAAHSRKLRVILDFVPNHSSDLHPWFLDSRTSRASAKRDWYLWHDPVPFPWMQPGEDKRPISEQFPNNWQSHFGGPAWTWDAPTQQFYCHSFLKEQPDLNWRNPAVQKAMFDAMRFWLDRGVDGFRMDVLWLLVKDAQFRSNAAGQPDFNADQPETHEIVRAMRALLDGYSGDRLLIGEIYLPLERLVRYYGAVDDKAVPQLNGAQLPFNFSLLQSPWNAEALAGLITQYEQLLPSGAWPNYVLGNHDQQRLATRVGAAQARVAAMLLLTLRGTPTLYNGDELGLPDVAIAPEQVRDPAGIRVPGKGRDPERSPMPWLPLAPNAGFTAPESTPWLPLVAEYSTLNVATERADAKSMLTLYRSLLALRRRHDTLTAGALADVRAEGSLLRYRRAALEDGESTDFLVLLNLGTETVTTEVPPGTVVLTTVLDGAGALTGKEDGTASVVTVEGNEGVVIALD